MRKRLIILLLTAVILFSSCDTPAEEVKYSDNILVSIDYGGVGFGTIAECTDAEVYFHTDRTVHIFMPDSDYSTYIEIGNFELSESDFKRLKELSAPEKITKIETTEMDACDGTSYFITLYGEDDTEIFRTGGYMPDGKEFWDTRNALIEIAENYGLEDIVEKHRATLE
ncbi:MAG: hypothetical protein IJY73_08205 [Oscillospiraceae bacterium]|nr:hypothetical protein [Oscillospiraceae bacterium]